MKEKDREFEIGELEDHELDIVAGGMSDAELIGGLDISCKDNTTCPNNSGNCVSGCACT